MSAATTNMTLALEQIALDARAWPREAIDEERVALFAELLRDARDAAERQRTGWSDPLPPLVVAGDGSGGYVLADGWHRYEARRRLGKGFDVVTVEVHSADGVHLTERAYELGLLYATISAKPLTREEKGAAVDRLIAKRPELSDRAIARLVGVSHRTVAAHRPGSGQLPTDRGGNDPTSESRSRSEPLRWEIAARRLAHEVAELLGSCRKLLGGADFKSAGRELYDALAELYGPEDAIVVIDELSAVVASADARARKTVA